MGSGPTQPTEQYFDKGLWGYDGTVWRKLPLLWGYTDRLAEQKVNLNANAGGNYLVHTTVPAGEVWVVTAHVAVNLNTAGAVVMRGFFGGTDMLVYDHGTPGAGVWHTSPPMNIVAKAGDILVGAFYGCTAGDDLYSILYGYKMAVT